MIRPVSSAPVGRAGVSTPPAPSLEKVRAAFEARKASGLPAPMTDGAIKSVWFEILRARAKAMYTLPGDGSGAVTAFVLDRVELDRTQGFKVSVIPNNVFIRVTKNNRGGSDMTWYDLGTVAP